MDKSLLSDFDFTVMQDEFLSALKLSKDDDDEMAALAAELLEKSKAFAHPAALYSFAPVAVSGDTATINGFAVKNAFIAGMLAGLPAVVPYVATCGIGLEQWSAALADPLERYWADTLKLLYLGKARDALYSKVKSAYFPDAKNISSLNPGSLKEWPIQGQIPLFKMLGGVTPDIGVVLTESMLMLPPKTISGIFFATEKYYENCMLCPRINCPTRRAAFAGNM